MLEIKADPKNKSKLVLILLAAIEIYYALTQYTDDNVVYKFKDAEREVTIEGLV